MPDVANPVTYALGFVSGTAGLHLAGVVIGDIAQHYAPGKVMLRAAGGVIAAFGVYFMLAATGIV
jgi:urease accessory protein